MSLAGVYVYFLCTIIIPLYLFLYFGPYSLQEVVNNPALLNVFNTVAWVVIGFGIIYLLDFLTLGSLRKFKRVNRFYYPIYRVISFLTFSNLYRNIYYVLISNFKSWKVITFIVLFTTITIFLANFNINRASAGGKFSQLEFYGESNGTFLNGSAYEDIDAAGKSQRAFIQNDIVKDDVIRLFVTHHYSSYDDSVKVLCNFQEQDTQYSTDSLKLECLSKFYQISVDDSLYSDLRWRFHLNPRNKHRGIVTYLDISHLKKGIHEVKIDLQNWFYENYQEIPFYKE